MAGEAKARPTRPRRRILTYVAVALIVATTGLALGVLTPVFRQADSIRRLKDVGLYYEPFETPQIEAPHIHLNVIGILYARLNGVGVGYVIREQTVDDSIVDSLENLPCVAQLGCWRCKIPNEQLLQRLRQLRSRYSLEVVDLVECTLPNGEYSKYTPLD